MAEHPTDSPANAAPDAAESIWQVIRRAYNKYLEYLRLPYGPQQPGARAEYEHLQAYLASEVPRLLAAVESQAARIGALESENAALKERQTVIMRVGDGRPDTSAQEYFNRFSEGE